MGWILIFLVVRLGAPKSDRLAFLRSTYSFVLFPLGEPHAPRLGLVLHADLVVGTGLPAVLEQTGDLVPDLGHPPGDGLLVAAPHERVWQQRLMPRKRMSSR